MEVAALGLRVDASGADSAAKSLENLTAQGARAEKSLGTVEGTAARMAASFGNVSSAARVNVSTMQGVEAAVNSLNEAEKKYIQSLVDEARQIGMGKGDRAAYIAQARGMSAAAQELARAVANKAEEMEKAEKSTSLMTKAGEQLLAVAKPLTGVFAAWKLSDFIQDSTMLAARFETMGVVMGVAGNNAGYTRKEMEDLSKSLQQQGISMLQSRNSLTQLATANIDLSKATGLARSAQDLAVVGNINSSEALERMIHGIKAGEAEVLRTLGLNVSFEASYKKLAQTLGVSSESLNENQKMMARTNAVLDGSTRYLGIYEESMTTAGKAMTSLTRYWEDFKVQAGDTFLPTLATGVFAVTDALKVMNAEIAASGQATDTVGRAINGTFKTTLETVAVLGTNVAYVFRAMGLEIGGLAAQATAVARLDFSGAAEIGRQMKEDAAANRAAVDKFSESVLNSNAAVSAGAKVSEEKRIADGKAAKAAEDAANKTLAQKTALTAFTKQFGTDAEKNKIAADEWKAKLGDLWSPEMIAKIEKRGKVAAAAAKTEQSAYASLMASINSKIAANAEELEYGHKLSESDKLRIQLQAQLDAGGKKLSVARQAAAKAALEELKRQEDMMAAAKRNVALYQEQSEAARQLDDDETKRSKALEAARQAMDAYETAARQDFERLQLEASLIGASNQQRAVALAQYDAELELKRKIDEIDHKLDATEEQREELRQRARNVATQKVASAQVRAYNDEWQKSFDQTSQALTDALMRGGKDAGEYLKDYFRTLVLRPVIQAIVNPIAAPITNAVQSALGQGQGGGGNLLGGSLTDWSTWGSKGGDWLMSQSTELGLNGMQSMGDAAFALGDTIKSVDTWLKDIPGFEGGIGSAVGYLGSIYSLTQGQYGSAIGSAVGTYIMPGIGTMIGGFLGGLVDDLFGSDSVPRFAATAEYRGGATSRGWTPGDQWNDAIYPAVSALAQGIGSALDATAKTFGQTAGYELFASFSKDAENKGVFGALNITGPDGKSLVDWSQYDTKWGGRHFSDGEAGEKEFMAAITADVKTAFQAMDIPTWSKQLINAAENIDGINAALQQIGAVKTVFDGLGKSMEMFSGITGELQTQLLSASGGLDALGANAGAFFEGFYGEQERMDILARNLRESLSGFDLSIDPAMGDDAKESFRSAVENAMAAGQGELAAKLLAMSGSFATAADYAQKQAEESSQAIIQAAQEAAQAAEELAASLRSSLIGLEARFADGGFSRQYQAQDAAGVLQGLFAGIGIEKDAGVLAQQILAATSTEVEDYFRQMWGMLDSDAARQQLIDVTGSLLDLAEASKQAAEAVDNAAKQQREQLEQQYLQLIGNTAELRRRELEALDPSNRALQELIWSIQDGQSAFADMGKAVDTAAATARQAWSNWGTANNLGLKYLGNTSGLEAQKAILQAQIGTSSDPADRLSKLQELIGIEEALGNAEMANRKAEQAALNARQSALQKELSAAQALLSAAQSLGEYAKSLQTSAASGLSDSDRLAALGDQYTMLMGKARGGDKDALSQLQGVSSDYLGLAQTLAVSGADYSVLSGRIASELDKLATGQESTANWQISSAQSQLDQLTAQSEALSAQVEISDATKGLIAKSMIDQAEIWDRENTQYLSMIELQGRMTDKLGAMPADIYKALKPAFDANASAIGSSVGRSVFEAINSLAEMLGLGSTPGFASGGYHVGGLRIVGENGPELEATGPSRIWNQSQLASVLGGGQGSAALISEVRALREQNARLEARLATIEQNTAQLADQFDNVTAGGNAMATEAMA